MLLFSQSLLLLKLVPLRIFAARQRGSLSKEYSMGRLRVTRRHDAFGEPIFREHASGVLDCNVPGGLAGADYLFARIGERRLLGYIGNKELSGGTGSSCICDDRADTSADRRICTDALVPVTAKTAELGLSDQVAGGDAMISSNSMPLWLRFATFVGNSDQGSGNNTLRGDGCDNTLTGVQG